MDRMAVLLVGRAAERMIFGVISTGAADDLAKATEITRGMVAHFGMAGEDLGEVAYEPDQPGFLGQAEWRPRRCGEVMAARIDEAVRDLVQAASDRADALLIRNRALLEGAARDLLARETLGEEELCAVRDAVMSEAAGRPEVIASRPDLRAGAAWRFLP